jgi:hypothetical protein
MKLPPVMLACGDSDVVFPSTVYMAQALQSRGYEHTVRIYPGLHAFFGLPPAWTGGACFRNAIPCSQELVAFLKRCDPASRPAVTLAPRRAVTFEWYSMVVYSLIFPGIPAVIAGIPILATALMCSIHSKGVQGVKTILRSVGTWGGRYGAFAVVCFAVDSLRALLRRDEIQEEQTQEPTGYAGPN